MNMNWLCITSVLSVTLVIFGQDIDTSHITVFPEGNQSIAGVFQVSFLNHLNQPRYAFNASEARRICLSLGVNIASKAQVQEALSRGLETCRFGWIDEHFAVIPRIKGLSNCGKSQTGLVTWRASVTQKFDVFCFNESDAAAQLKDTTTDSSLSSRDHSTQTTHSTSSSSLLPSSSSAAKTIDTEAEPAHYIGSAQGSAGGKAILITSTCTLLLTAIIIFVYLKLRRSCSQSSDMKQQQEYVEKEDWSCMKNIKETKDAQEDERIEVDDSAS
ncbi:lymphatic vessel endothelial hyaluronic acid receptor 1a [Xiphias gladius]|uniref:lymphatic vessel endothelial hyaluronic acid receptor 1a n=1 Tax=Xiphias gladius TaxID=8245 RepID=UPI001A991805|nr:lymphatic vessel endothelial hyaluronic acid receptor 1a [Xiphias gladius]XP_039994338.1 lymphatic vessel endothelial hyaluronic acid receptor 1a [Xiphias gladius]